jgi:proteasome lid subunit RPN8/RPN11
MLSSNELSYEQKVCNIFKETTIHQRLEELKERTKATGKEHAFNVCSGGRVTEVIEGDDIDIDVAKINKECNNKIDICIHSHPHDKTYPSAMDFSTELNSQPRIASCIYGAKSDSITCYRTSDEFKNKYRQSLDDAINKVNEIVNKHNNTNNPDERRRLLGEYMEAFERYMYLENKIKLIAIKDIYPNIDSIKDYVNYITHYNPKVGNFGDVWIKDCGKM